MTPPPVHDHRYLAQNERVAAVATAAARTLAPEVLNALVRQNESLPRSEARASAIQKIKSGPVAFVATGQQLGLFGGPLLTLYKALTAIRAAELLSAETGAVVLPMFWLQGDDHDLKEVERYFFPSSHQSDGQGATKAAEAGIGEVSLALAPAQREDHRVSVAEVVLPQKVEELMAQLRIELGESENNPALRDVAAAYVPGASMQEAFLRTLASFLAEYPILFFDSRDEYLGKLRAPVFLRAFDAADEIEAQLLRRNESDETPEQVMVRAGSPLFFLHPDGKAGPRYRIEKAGRTYRFLGRDGSLTEDAVRTFISARPESMSTSALLRPLLQDSLLPVAAYVGGAAELQYLEQIRDLYPIFGLPRSLVIPRARFLLTDAKLNRLLNQLDLSLDTLREQSLDELFLALVRRSMPEDAPADPVAELRRAIDRAFEQAGASFGAVDPSLPGFVDRTKEKIARSLDGLSDKFYTAMERKHGVVRGRLYRAHGLVLPFGEHQERIFGWTAMVARHGMTLIPALLRRIEPFSTFNGGEQRVDLASAES